MYIVGIDPGVSGALTLVAQSDEALVDIRDMPMLRVKIGSSYNSQMNIGTLIDILREFRTRGAVHIYCEQVGSTPGKSPVFMFRFGENFGVLKGVFGAMGLPVTYVHPAEWKRVMRCPREKDGARLRAGQVFPVWAGAFGKTKDDGRAEASLIALYGVRHLRSGGI